MASSRQLAATKSRSAGQGLPCSQPRCIGARQLQCTRSEACLGRGPVDHKSRLCHHHPAGPPLQLGPTTHRYQRRQAAMLSTDQESLDGGGSREGSVAERRRASLDGPERPSLLAGTELREDW